MEYFDLVEQECPAPTGSAAFDFSASGALSGRFTFDARMTTTGQTCTYTARDGSGNVETGLGTWNETAKTLTRTTIYASSNGDAAESFSGTVTVAMDLLATQEKIQYEQTDTGLVFIGSSSSVTQSFTGSAFTKVSTTLNTVLNDPNGWWDSTNKRLVFNRLGKYRVMGFVQFATAYTTQLAVYKNGTADTYGPVVQNNGQASAVDSVVDITSLSDYVEVYAYTSTTVSNLAGTNRVVLKAYYEGK